jgi:hypothetical protein
MHHTNVGSKSTLKENEGSFEILEFFFGQNEIFKIN